MHANDEQWVCVHCGDVIGAYEPMVTISDGYARHTSRTSEKHGDRPIGACYHSCCYQSVHGDRSSEWRRATKSVDSDDVEP